MKWYMLWPIVYRYVTSIDRWKNWFFFLFFLSFSLSSNYVPIGDERNQIKERTNLPLGKKVFRWCQSSSMYAETLFVQYNITNKTMNIKKTKKKRKKRETYGSHETVLLMSYYTTQLVTIEFHLLTSQISFKWKKYLQSSSASSSFSFFSSTLLLFDCSCLMTKDNLIGIELIVVYRFHTSLNS